MPCWDEECEEALASYNEASPADKPSRSDELMALLGQKRRKRWNETISTVDFTHSSRKAWQTINRLTGRSNKKKNCPVDANKIASVLVKNGTWSNRSRVETRLLSAKIKLLRKDLPEKSHLSVEISLPELIRALALLKTGKAPGPDHIHPEFLKNLGPDTMEWLRLFLSDCLTTCTIPAVWKTAKVVATLKPNKEESDPKSYRPISLLCLTYKLMERIILTRINPIVEQHLPPEQAGFREGKSTTDQVTRLVNDIEESFKRKEKFGLLLIDLSAAYDTIWHKGLLYKLLQIIPDIHLVRFIMLLVQDRYFTLETSNGSRSRKRKLRNGLPQGSVLAPTLFNIYISDMPPTLSRKYLYADDSALGYAAASFELIESALEEDLEEIARYYSKWHLKLSMDQDKPKTVCSVFHLAHKKAGTTLSPALNGKPLKHEDHPVYLGVTLDRSLTFNQHLQNVTAKTRSRVNLIKKLAGTDWGADFNTLRTSTLALVFSTAEYASPAWCQSRHTKKLDAALNEALRTISGAMKPTPVQMLPVLAGIPPPDIRRNNIAMKLSKKATQPGSLVPSPRPDTPTSRLKRSHFLSLSEETPTDYGPGWMMDHWIDQWSGLQTPLHDFIPVPSLSPPGCHLDRKAWVNLNRIRSGCAKTKAFLHKIGVESSPSCVCGSNQTLQHILTSCPVLKPPNGVDGLKELDEDTIHWLRNYEDYENP